MKVKFDRILENDSRNKLKDSKMLGLLKKYLQELSKYHFPELDGLIYLSPSKIKAVDFRNSIIYSDDSLKIALINANNKIVCIEVNDKGFIINKDVENYKTTEPIFMKFEKEVNQNTLVESSEKKKYVMATFEGNDVVKIDGTIKNNEANFKISIYLNVSRDCPLDSLDYFLEPEYVYNYDHVSGWVLENRDDNIYGVHNNIYYNLDRLYGVNFAKLRRIERYLLGVFRQSIPEYGYNKPVEKIILR